MNWNTDLAALDEGTPVCITIQRADGTRAMTRAWMHRLDSHPAEPRTWSYPEDEHFESLLKSGDQVIAWHPDENAIENGLVPYDPAKPVTSKERAMSARSRVLADIEAAQMLLYRACQTACPLQGWGDGPWEWIGDHADATKALWHRVNNAPDPTGHD